MNLTQFCLSNGGHLGCFQFLAITNRASMNTDEQVFLQKVIEFFEYKAKDGKDGYCGT